MADGYISQIKLPNEETYDFRDRNLKVYTGSCSTAAGTAIKDVVTDGIFTLEKGAVLFVNFTNTNSAAVGNLKLKINGEADTSAKPIKYLVNGNDPANIPGAGYLRANQTYMFRYDGTNWVADLNYYTYSNDFANKIGHYNNILARKAIAAESLIVGDETGYEKVASGVTFNLAYPIVWCTGAVNANASNYANMFLQHYDRNIATGAKSGFTSAANKVIYLIVTISGNIATIDSNIITDTLPSSDDGKVYISLGKLGAQSTGANYFFLYPVHSMFWYKNGAIREYSGASQYALAAPLSGISGADDLKAIEAISGTTGLLKKTAANTWTLDTSSYVTSSGITSVTIGATSPVVSSTATAQTGSSASTTISLADAYGDTKNPYGAKAKNLVLAGPSSGSNAAPSFRALVAADIPTLAYVPATSGVNDVNTLVNTGIYNITSGQATNAPKGYGYGQLLVMSYRKHTGNTTTDWASQIYLHNGVGTETGNATGPGNVLYYRTSNTSSSNSWFSWQKAVHVDDTYTKVGDTNKPVYIAADGTATPISYTIAKSVPSDAVFTDHYAWTDITSKPTTISGYGITDAKIASGTITLGSNTISPVTAINWDSTNKKLTRTINGTAADVVTAATLRTDLELSNALHFIGITSTTLTDGSTTSTLTAKSTGSLTKTTGFVDGDVVMDGDQLREYVWSGSAWRLLGITTSTAYTQPASTATNTWIAQISQGTDGKITATTGSLNTSGTWNGNAGTATKLAASKTLWGQTFDGSANITGNLIDVGNQIKLLSGQTELQFLTSTGGAANGKFGKLGLNTTYANVDFTNYILDVNGKARIGALDGGQHVINGNVQLNAQSGSYNEGLRINRSTTGYANVYLGGTRSSASGNQTGGWWIGTLSTPADATSNGDAITNTVFTISNNNTSDTLSIKGTRGATIGTNSGWAIKPRLAVGTTYNTSYTLYIAGTGYFTNNVNIVTTSTTANTAAYGTLTLGNNANVSSTTAHSEGSLVLYSAATAAHTLRGISTTTAYTHSLPNKTGILVTLDGSPAANIGSETQPVYITKDGVVNACTTYANASVNYATSAGKLSNTTAIGSDVKPVYFTNGGVPQATATEMLRGFTTTSAGTDLNAMYDSGMYGITGGTLTNYPTGGANYATILTVAYRKPSGNTKPDYAWQMGNFTQNTNRMWYRTSQAAAWNEWRQIVNIATNTGVGGTSTPVYIDANGEVLAGTALKALAYKDSLTYSDVGAAAAEHGTHVTTATVQSALGISSSGSTSKALTEKGTFVTFGTSNLTIGNTSSTAMAGNTTVTNVSFTAASDNAEYPILIKNSTGNTTTAAGTKFNTEVTINPSNQTITANEFIGNLKGNNIIPTMQKTYTGNYYGTGDNYDSTSFFFISLRPDTWYKPWKIKFKIHSYCPAHTECDSVTYGLYTGRLGSYSYANWNERNDSYAHYYTSVRTLNQTGFNAGLSHALGICLRYASNYTNTGWPRTFEVEIYDYEGCTVSLLDAPLLWANWPNAANNYNGWSVPDAVTRGLCETNDATSNNDDRTLQDIMYFRFKSGAAGIGRYTLLMEESTGVYSSLTTTFPSSNTPLTTLTMNTGVKYKLGRIIYFNQGANRAGNTNIGNDNQYFTAYSLIDGRYTFQYTAGALTGYKPFYMVGTLDANGFFTIDPAATAWSQDLPTANTNKVYVFLGTVYPDTNAYRIALELDHPIYTFTNGALKQINPGDITGNASTVGGHTVEADVPSDAVFTDTTYTFDGTYNASSNKAATVSTVTNAINALDGTITGSGSTTKTITALSQTNGKVSATFSDIAFPVTSVAGLSGAITASNLTETLGLSKALRFVGVTTTDMTGGTATNHTYTGKPAGISDYTPAVGDVVINSTKQDEWVCTAVSGTTYTWERLGSDTSYKIVQSAVADPTAALTTSTTFIDTISQNTNGVITATKKTLPTASTEIAGIIKIGTAATDAMAGDTNITNVAFTAATDSNEYPILLKNSTGSTTTAASAKFANTSGKMTTINPNTGIITAPGGISAGHLTLTSTSAESHLTFSRTGWNYITMPNNDSSVISIGYGTPADNTTQRLVIYKTGTVRPGANGSQNLGDDTHKWNKVYGVNFYGTFNGTATSAQQLAAREIDNSDLNQFSSGGALKYAWVSGGNNILSKPTNVNAFGVIAMKTAANWTGQILMSTDTEPGLYWRTNLTTETPTYGSWTPLASGNGGVYYGTCATAADVVEKVVVCKHYHTLKAGDIIVVTFTNSNTQAQPKLNVNNTGAVSVKMAYSGGIVDLGSTSQLRFTCTFIYDGTYWLIINQQNAIQLATSSGNVNWRSVLLSDSNSVSENFTPSANTLGRTYAAHNVKYQPSTGTLRAPIMKTPKVQIEYDHVNKAHIQWNDTDSSIDFIFD